MRQICVFCSVDNLISREVLSLNNLNINYITQKPVSYWHGCLFNIQSLQLSGNTGCNSLAGVFQQEDNHILFSDIITTKMACVGEGEQAFLETLSHINQYNMNNEGELQLMDGELLLMKFKKIK